MRAGVAFPLAVNNVMIKSSVTIISNEDCSNIIDNADDPDDDDGTPYMTDAPFGKLFLSSTREWRIFLSPVCIDNILNANHRILFFASCILMLRLADSFFSVMAGSAMTLALSRGALSTI